MKSQRAVAQRTVGRRSAVRRAAPENVTRRFDALDPIFHERSRLTLMTLLCANQESVSFTELRALCGMTDGNLSRHLYKLADASLVKIDKRFVGGVPNTSVRVTAEGVEQFSRYVEELAAVVEEADKAVKAGAKSTRRSGLGTLRPSQ